MSNSQYDPLSIENIPQARLQSLQYAAKIYAYANSLLFKQPDQFDQVHATHAPFCLFPSPFPRYQFEKAIKIQTSYNRLYCNMASSSELIREVIGKSISTVDPFIGRLYQLWQEREDCEEASRSSLGIFRNDYLLHESSPSSSPEIKQIEFNTVSVSLGGLATKISDLHRYLCGLTPLFKPSQLPPNNNQSLQSISKALRMAHEHYLLTEAPTKPVIILMIVKPVERGIFDQSLIEYELHSKQDPIRLVRVSCHAILQYTSLDPITKKLIYLDINNQTQFEVSVAYYRSMYGPEDFLSEEDWIGRHQLECSRAINCPDYSMQLVGCKKFQQVLTDSNFLERYQNVLTEGIEESEWIAIQSTWTSIYPLDDPEGFRIASDPNQAINFVLKPQREGGGHNIYGLNIPKFVESLTELERKAYILMKLVKPPSTIFNYFIRNGDNATQANQKNGTTDVFSLKTSQVICELGIFGVCLLQRDSPLQHDSSSCPLPSTKLLFNFESGHLLRTKNSDAEEGGLALGISCLDSPLLV